MPRGPGPYVPKKCAVVDCDKTALKYRSLCGKHYGRWRRYRDTSVARHVVHKGTPLERVLQKINIDDKGCWNWTGYLDQSGYAVYRFKEGSSRVARWLYEKTVAPIPKPLTIDHVCRNRACINPKHMEPVTMRENLMRGDSFSGINHRKTVCVHGHEYSESNTGKAKAGGRFCKTCQRDRAKRYRAKLRGVT